MDDGRQAFVHEAELVPADGVDPAACERETHAGIDEALAGRPLSGPHAS